MEVSGQLLAGLMYSQENPQYSLHGRLEKNITYIKPFFIRICTNNLLAFYKHWPST